MGDHCDSYGEPSNPNRGNVPLKPIDPEHARKVYAWLAAWRSLSPKQQAAWHLMSKAERESSKQLDAEQFTAMMRTHA